MKLESTSATQKAIVTKDHILSDRIAMKQSEEAGRFIQTESRLGVAEDYMRLSSEDSFLNCNIPKATDMYAINV